MIDFGQIGLAVATALAPFMPFLIGLSKAAGQKFADTIAEKGGEAAWQKAQTLWGKLKTHLGDDQAMTSAATLVASSPENDSLNMILAAEVGKRLKDKPELANEIAGLLGGPQAIAKQLQIAEREGLVQGVNQLIEGTDTHAIQIALARTKGRVINARQTVRSNPTSSS